MPDDSTLPRTLMPLLRKPDATDGAKIWELVKACKPLDENSMYCNLIQADHFAETSVVADLDGQIVGWISGYMIPAKQELFIWQVAVGHRARGLGLGKKMLLALIERDACEGATVLKTTITESNKASWALFRGFARTIGGRLSNEPHFKRDTHFEGRHDTENLVAVTLPDQMAPDQTVLAHAA
jgi:L-2,4-diaminobutyric acid acetyltransferase